jgi:hypothetical protein
MHGGAAPQVRASAHARLMALQPRAIQALDALLNRDENPMVQLRAVREVFNRTEGKPHVSVTDQRGWWRRHPRRQVATVIRHPARGTRVRSPNWASGAIRRYEVAEWSRELVAHSERSARFRMARHIRRGKIAARSTASFACSR